MDRANSHTKSYNIPRSFEAMYINIKYELRAWKTCARFPFALLAVSVGYRQTRSKLSERESRSDLVEVGNFKSFKMKHTHTGSLSGHSLNLIAESSSSNLQLGNLGNCDYFCFLFSKDAFTSESADPSLDAILKMPDLLFWQMF